MNATSTIPERPARRGGLVGPVILIGLGIVFLLNNMGLLGWEVWEGILRLWPVLLIAVGLDILIGRRSALGSLLVVVVMLGVLAASVWWSGAWLGAGTALTGETISQPLERATRADVQIGMGAGTLSVGALEDASQLIEGSVAGQDREPVTRDFSISSGTAYFALRSRGQFGWIFPFADRRNGEGTWDLRLNRDVPMRLKIDAGAGTATLDLARLHLTDLDVNAGVGKITVTLPQQGVLVARVNGGVGETTILIPAGMAARIQADTGLGQVQVLGNYQRQGDAYVSPDYDPAGNRVELIVKGGVGRLTIRQIDGEQ